MKLRKASGKTTAVIVIFMLAAGCGYAFVQSRRSKEAANVAAAMYQTQMAGRGNVYVAVSGSGTVEAAATAQIVPNKVSGEITRIYKSEGDFVKAGDLIAEIDSGEYRLRYKLAEAEMQSARLNLEQAKRNAAQYPTEAKSSLEQARAAYLSARQGLADIMNGSKPQEIEQQKSSVRQQKVSYENAEADYGRMKELFDQGAVSKQQLEQYEVKKIAGYEQYLSAQEKLDSITEKASREDISAAKARLQQTEAGLRLAESNAKHNSKLDAVAQAEAAYETAKVNLETAKKNMESVRIIAPISGIIWGFTAVVGDNISLSGTVSSIGSIVDTTKLRVRASVDESEIKNVSAGQTVKISTDAFNDREFAGTVFRIAPKASVNDGIATYDVLINLDRRDTGLKPGMNADVEVLVDRSENVVTVPVSAIMDQNGRKAVMVMDGQETESRRVVVGKMSDSTAEIKSGVSEGEMIVTNPSNSSFGGKSGDASGSSERGDSGGMTPGGPGMGAMVGGGPPF